MPKVVIFTRFMQWKQINILNHGEKRIKVSLGRMSPLDYRKSLELVI